MISRMMSSMPFINVLSLALLPCCSLSCSMCYPSCCSVLQPELRSLLVSSHPRRPLLVSGFPETNWRSGSSCSFLPEIGTWFLFKILSAYGDFLLIREPPSLFSHGCSNFVSSTLPDQAAHRRGFSASLFWCLFHSSTFWFLSLLLVLPAGSCIRSHSWLWFSPTPCLVSWHGQS